MLLVKRSQPPFQGKSFIPHDPQCFGNETWLGKNFYPQLWDFEAILFRFNRDYCLRRDVPFDYDRRHHGAGIENGNIPKNARGRLEHYPATMDAYSFAEWLWQLASRALIGDKYTALRRSDILHRSHGRST